MFLASTSSDIGLAALVAVGFVFVVLFHLGGNRSVIDDQRELARRRANWKGTNGLAARQREVAAVRLNRAGAVAFAVALVVTAVSAILFVRP